MQVSLRVVKVVAVGFVWLVLIPGWSRAQSIIEGAKKEGRVVFYASMEAQSAQRLIAQFEKRYPFYKSRCDPLQRILPDLPKSDGG
jgi:hypothetical protein